ncbi:BnaA10g17260D [Brassica napus]|uniref:(rape) hypothetical protein n=1 Tax=Brassica napus TaxID=3708 RepID=A0A078HKM5_BRANA|nr:unnamed protein product [Brassica napus]CDY38432.1 BnaA10g17260D [Brassica napus]
MCNPTKDLRLCLYLYTHLVSMSCRNSIICDVTTNEASDKYLDKLFEFEEKPKKLAVENALKKLNKGPDRRYTNVW